MRKNTKRKWKNLFFFVSLAWSTFSHDSARTFSDRLPCLFWDNFFRSFRSYHEPTCGKTVTQLDLVVSECRQDRRLKSWIRWPSTFFLFFLYYSYRTDDFDIWRTRHARSRRQPSQSLLSSVSSRWTAGILLLVSQRPGNYNIKHGDLH